MRGEPGSAEDAFKLNEENLNATKKQADRKWVGPVNVAIVKSTKGSLVESTKMRDSVKLLKASALVEKDIEGKAFN
eukprot:CAMPEP_0170513204 /NCGR_PEP_ID=MMETSP0208-20121228/67271_1 /TAXON_ID=197538 /ORGANISM="Strombidium inclinatum, Strain S3" /LENGTH=75 /DNA_ID=CAMNT_0010796915 /DNA_START=2489 /DNA_END=2716 /DNA_ORIENTATION=+